MSAVDEPDLARLPKIGGISSSKADSGIEIPETPKIAQNRATGGVDWVEFVIHTKPLPKSRPRFANGRAYTPKATRDYEELLRWHFRAVFSDPFRGDVAVKIVFMTASRADVDNLAKAVLDAGNGFLYRDDSQVKALDIRKLKSDREEIRIIISEMNKV